MRTFLSTFLRTFLRTFPFEDFFEYFFEDFFEDFFSTFLNSKPTSGGGWGTHGRKAFCPEDKPSAGHVKIEIQKSNFVKVTLPPKIPLKGFYLSFIAFSLLVPANWELSGK